jgi:hypothetical protein
MEMVERPTYSEAASNIAQQYASHNTALHTRVEEMVHLKISVQHSSPGSV